jgi:protein phosphatase
MSRFAIAPQWLVYLPPTMSPCETSARDGWLERPEEAFTYFREREVAEVVCEEKHMGSRAIIALCRSNAVARLRFGIVGPETGAIWTRTGRAFFSDAHTTEAVLDRLRAIMDRLSLWTELETDWLLLDTEVMPWSAKAGSLIESQYAPVAVSSRVGLHSAVEALGRAALRGVPIAALAQKFADRADRVSAYATAWAPYVWPISDVDDLRIAPFHLLASEGRVWFDHDHLWHMNFAEQLGGAGSKIVTATQWHKVGLADEPGCANAVKWWEDLVVGGGEGMVVKPKSFTAQGKKGLLQPALKVRGKEYLRIIYGPEYDAAENLDRLRERSLGGKRNLALREFALGHEALKRFVSRQPLRRVHECVFGVLALESEAVDPRL